MGQASGCTGSQCPPSSATQIAACSTGVPRQMVVMNATDTWNTFRGQHSPALHQRPPDSFPLSLAPPLSPWLNADYKNKVVRTGHQIPPAQTSFPSTKPAAPPHLRPFRLGGPLPLPRQQTATFVTSKVSQGMGIQGHAAWGRSS